MAYAAFSVVFGEQPSAAKWNILGTNDSSFNDGTGIAGLYKNLLTVDSNPYKFRAYRSAAYNSVNATLTPLPFDAESFDTNNNHDSVTNKGRYTAPVSGFYQFNARYACAHSGFRNIYLYKNGAQVAGGNIDFYTPGQATSATVSDCIQLSSGDYVEAYYYVDGVNAITVGSDQAYFSGFLVSRT